MARASDSGGGTLRNSASRLSESTTPSTYLPGSLRAESSWTFTARVYYGWIPKDAGDAGNKVVEKWGRQEPAVR